VSTEPDAELLDFVAEYEEPVPEPPPKPLRRHARPRNYTRVAIVLLSGTLAVVIGLSALLWLQLDAAHADRTVASSVEAELSAALDDSRSRVAELEETVAVMEEQLSTAAADLQDAQQQLSTVTDESATLGDRLGAAEADLSELRRNADALASAVFGSVDPVHACRLAADRMAAEVDQDRRGVLRQLAEQAAQACAAAAEVVDEAVPRARTVLSGS
jgi:ABC-type transporter Mla subunit MlaD